MTLFQNKYRVESARLRGWDYSTPSAYFITICSQDMKHYFGKVINKEMVLSPTGEIVEEEWLKTPEIREYAILDQYVVMPNHLHAIIALTENLTKYKYNSTSETTRRVVSTNLTLRPDSLSSIIGQFKSVCTKRIRKEIDKSFGWQGRFYDRIIRSEKELATEREYIFYNPARWGKDEFYSAKQ